MPEISTYAVSVRLGSLRLQVEFQCGVDSPRKCLAQPCGAMPTPAVGRNLSECLQVRPDCSYEWAHRRANAGSNAV